MTKCVFFIQPKHDNSSEEISNIYVSFLDDAFSSASSRFSFNIAMRFFYTLISSLSVRSANSALRDLMVLAHPSASLRADG